MQEEIEIEQCEACGELVIEETMSYVGNEKICESCRESGYGL